MFFCNTSYIGRLVIDFLHWNLLNLKIVLFHWLKVLLFARRVNILEVIEPVLEMIIDAISNKSLLLNQHSQ